MVQHYCHRISIFHTSPIPPSAECWVSSVCWVSSMRSDRRSSAFPTLSPLLPMWGKKWKGVWETVNGHLVDTLYSTLNLIFWMIYDFPQEVIIVYIQPFYHCPVFLHSKWPDQEDRQSLKICQKSIARNLWLCFVHTQRIMAVITKTFFNKSVDHEITWDTSRTLKRCD